MFSYCVGFSEEYVFAFLLSYLQKNPNFWAKLSIYIRIIVFLKIQILVWVCLIEQRRTGIVSRNLSVRQGDSIAAQQMLSVGLINQVFFSRTKGSGVGGGYLCPPPMSLLPPPEPLAPRLFVWISPPPEVGPCACLAWRAPHPPFWR